MTLVPAEAVSWDDCSLSCQVLVINETLNQQEGLTLENMDKHAHTQLKYTLTGPAFTHTHTQFLHDKKAEEPSAAALKRARTLFPASVTSANARVLPLDTSVFNNWWLREPKGSFDWHACMSAHAHVPAFRYTHRVWDPRNWQGQWVHRDAGWAGSHPMLNCKHTHFCMCNRVIAKALNIQTSPPGKVKNF